MIEWSNSTDEFWNKLYVDGELVAILSTLTVTVYLVGSKSSATSVRYNNVDDARKDVLKAYHEMD